MGKGFKVTCFNPHCGWKRQIFRGGTWLSDKEWEMDEPGLGMKIVGSRNEF